MSAARIPITVPLLPRVPRGRGQQESSWRPCVIRCR
jgi:hypothetical protein